MKKYIHVVSLLLAVMMLTVSLASCDWGAHPVPDEGKPSASESFTPHKFGVEDAAVKGVRLGMTQEQVKKILGEPDEINDVTGDGFIYGTCVSYTYGGMTLLFFDVNEGDDLTLGSIVADTSDVIFVGGLHVGSTKEDVLNTFTYEENPQPLYFEGDEESYGDYIYGNINDSWFLEEKPTDEIYCAYINRYYTDNDEPYMMEYYYYPPLDWNADKSEYSGVSYGMVFYVDIHSDIVTGIRIDYDLAR